MFIWSGSMGFIVPVSPFLLNEDHLNMQMRIPTLHASCKQPCLSFRSIAYTRSAQLISKDFPLLFSWKKYLLLVQQSNIPAESYSRKWNFWRKKKISANNKKCAKKYNNILNWDLETWKRCFFREYRYIFLERRKREEKKVFCWDLCGYNGAISK